jgi:hypothetical protein
MRMRAPTALGVACNAEIGEAEAIEETGLKNFHGRGKLAGLAFQPTADDEPIPDASIARKALHTIG